MGVEYELSGLRIKHTQLAVVKGPIPALAIGLNGSV